MKVVYTIGARDIRGLIRAATRLVDAAERADRARYSPGTKLRLGRALEGLLYTAGALGRKLRREAKHG